MVALRCPLWFSVVFCLGFLWNAIVTCCPGWPCCLGVELGEDLQYSYIQHSDQVVRLEFIEQWLPLGINVDLSAVCQLLGWLVFVVSAASVLDCLSHQLLYEGCVAW